MTKDAAPSVLVMTPVDDPDAAVLEVGRDGPATIGRSRDCRHHLDRTEVSKHHACIDFHEGDWRVTDLGSHNGTTVNRIRLTPQEPVILRDGDRLALGPCRYEISFAGRDARGDGLSSGTYATHASIFLRLRDESRDVQEVGWEEFRKRYAPVVVGYSRNAGLPAQDADDVLQDVMLGFYRVAGAFEYDPTKGRFRAYLKRATLNAIRKRARRRGESALIPDEWLDEDARRADARWEEHWAEQMLARALEEARRRFEERTMEAFDLYARRGVPAEEVAERLGMAVNSVYQAKKRVLNFVRGAVDRLRTDEG